MIAWDLRSAREHPRLAAGEPPEGMLSAPEQVFFGHLKTPRRRKEWLLGRWAAKALCRSWLRSQGRDVAASSLTIAPDDDGAPYVLLPFQGRLPVTLSLSHRDELALCVLADTPSAPMGADLELCEARSQAFVEDFFTLREAATVAAGRDAQRAVTEIWSLKESALKAVRLGLRLDTRRVEVVPRDRPGQGWQPAGVELALPDARLCGWAYVRDEGDYVASMAWLGTRPVPPPTDALRGAPVLDPTCERLPARREVAA